jgi:hypothetical protein
MRDTLPLRASQAECGVVNLDMQKNSGTHWVAYWVLPASSIYFDSYGLPPPNELLNYLPGNILRQTFQLQTMSQVICGHMCVFVLHQLNIGKSFKEIILSIYMHSI